MERPARVFLEELLLAHGPSGHEGPAADVFRRYTGTFARVEGDVLGNSYAAVGPQTGPATLLLAHADEIGLIVTHVEDADADYDGLLRVRPLGTWDPTVLVGQHVEVRRRDGSTVPGVVGKRPIHLQSAADQALPVTLAGLWVDVGARDADDARRIVEIGDTAVADRPPRELADGRLSSRALDNRTGMWIAAEAARRVAEAGGGGVPTIACAPVLEETLGEGARAAAHRIAPAVTLVIDVTHATDVPGVHGVGIGRVRLGHGPVLHRGLGLHPGLYDRVRAVAERDGIAVQVDAVAGTSSTWTDVDGALEAHAGSALGLLSLPLRHMHSPSEACDLGDLERAAELVAQLCLSLGPDDRWER